MTTVQNLLSAGGVLGFLGILVKLAVDWIRGYRKDRADDELAEGSVAPTLAERNLSALDAQIVVLGKAHAEERASYERRIVALEKDVARLTSERDTLFVTVETMRQQMAEMQDRLTAMTRQLDALPRPT